MPTPISGQMRASLLAVTSLNDDITMTQTRLNTGRKVNTALDDPATYFKAQTFQSKAMSLEMVNKEIALTLSNVKAADQAMTTMLKNLNAQLSAMKDARSVAVGTAAAAVNITGKVNWATNATTMVDTGTNLSNANLFQNGDVLRFDITDKNGTVQSAFFQAATTVNNTGKNGLSQATALQFNSVADLQTQIQAAFGSTDISLTAAANSGINLRLNDATKSLGITQVVNNGAAAGNVFADLTSIFGAPTTNSVLATGNSNQYSPTAATTNQDSLDTRKAVADGFVTMLNQLNALVSDAFVPGLANLLTNPNTGNTVVLNGDGSTQQKIALNQALDVASLGFNFNATTQTSTDTGTAFNNDTTLGNAITKVTTAIQAVTRLQKSLANQSAALNNRTTFNKALSESLNTNSDALTAADTTEEAANLASLQTRQTFATNNMAATKQQEQGLIQLLR